MKNNFLPTSLKDLRDRGWDGLDIILVTGDAYVDHPTYGASLIGRTLESAGFKVGIIAQPDYRNTDNFKALGRPKLFFGVTAGNLDSMVANYTANRKPRSNDDYSPGGRPGLRPDRATIIYTNRLREAFPGAAIVIGGLEASMRRLGHYDYWSDNIRRSILLDSKADILVYGMGENAGIEIARRLKAGESIKHLDNIRGTVVARNDLGGLANYIEIPSFEDIISDKFKFNESFRTIYNRADPVRGKTVVQKHAERFVIQFPPPPILSQPEMDRIYSLPYARAWHPSYIKDGGVPGFETVRFSITSHRGCPGACSFCSLFLHQGRIVQSRSGESIVAEANRISSDKSFRGTITDIGGPTANMYMAKCGQWARNGACRDRQCLMPARCPGLELGYEETLKLWKEVSKVPKVKHVFVGSGVRYDLLIDKESDKYLKELCAHHVSGQLKVAPEHSEGSVLRLMNKPGFDIYRQFVRRFKRMNGLLGKRQFLVNYFIASHPGSTLEDMLNLALKLSGMGIHPEQIQDFLPLPMTISACMYHTGIDPFSGKAVYVARGLRERKLQRALIQHRQPGNRRYVVEALKKLNKSPQIFS